MKRLIYTIMIILTLIILSSSAAYAAIEFYVVKDVDNNVYQYKLQDLLDSYNSEGLLWKDFHTRMMRSGVYAVYDNRTKQYVDFVALLSAYNSGVDVLSYTGDSSATIATMPEILKQVSTGQDGKLIFTDIVRFGDILTAINNVSSISELQQIIETQATTLGLNLAMYNSLNGYGKNQAIKAVIDARPAAGYPLVAVMTLQFESAVTAALSAQSGALNAVNAAVDAELIMSALTINALLLELDITRFDILLPEQKNTVLTIILGGRLYPSAQAVRTAFFNAIQSVGVTRIITYVDYSHTLNEAVTLQMGRAPQTDLYGGGWQTADRNLVEWYMNAVNFVDEMRPAATIKIGPARLRAEANTTSNIITNLAQGAGSFYIINQTQDSLGYKWYRLLTGNRVGWVREDLLTLTEKKGEGIFQFLLLSGTTNLIPAEVNEKILNGKGILHGHADAFILGAQQYNINEIFLIALALHESANGTSTLATGVVYNGITVYNMFGIGAFDADPINKGAEFAFNRGWFTPELAIIGGAEFISNRYINNARHRQDTLYKMRWNPAFPGVHQYATDVGWAAKQVSSIKLLYDQITSYVLRFEIPRYRQD